MSNQKANISIILNDFAGGNKAECYCEDERMISIEIYEVKETEGKSHRINLDKSTAIKLAKTLRTEINKIES